MRAIVSRAARLAAVDLRLVLGDPLLCLMPFVPLLAAVALRILIPALSGFVESATGLRLLDYADLIRVVVVLFGGMFLGMVSGFLLLDDRDDGVSAYWGAMPVGRAGYLAARLALFTAAAFAVGTAAGFAFGLGGASVGSTVAAAAIGAIQTPIFALFLAAIAADKVEGLAMVKALSGLDLAPLAVLLPLPARAVGWPFPQYWAAELALGRTAWPMALALALASGAAWIVPLAFRYRRRVD